MSLDRQALLSLYHDPATTLLDEILLRQHEPEGNHQSHVALVEALADAHTDGRGGEEQSPAEAVASFTAAVDRGIRGVDLAAIEARLNSSIIHRAQLATDAHALLAEVRRLERDVVDSDELGCDAAGDVEELRAEVRRLTGERDEARADVAWLTEEVTRQTGATVDGVAEGLALARAGGVHRPVVNVRMGEALRARYAAERAPTSGAKEPTDDLP